MYYETKKIIIDKSKANKPYSHKYFARFKWVKLDTKVWNCKWLGTYGASA